MESLITTAVKDSSFEESGLVPFELELLSKAFRYQQWIIDAVQPFLGQRILEIGSGIGNMSRWLPVREKLVVTEASVALIPLLRKAVQEQFKGDSRVVVNQVDLSQDWVKDLSQENLDTIISFNVLEHIENDEQAFADLIQILKNSKASSKKRLVTFVPAHQWAHGTIDQGYGHFRRYSAADLTRLQQKYAPGAKVHYEYFNLIGLFSWYVLGKILKKKKLGFSAVSAFEKICPWVQKFDHFVHAKLKIPFGQSLLYVVEF